MLREVADIERVDISNSSVDSKYLIHLPSKSF